MVTTGLTFLNGLTEKKIVILQKTKNDIIIQYERTHFGD